MRLIDVEGIGSLFSPPEEGRIKGANGGDRTVGGEMLIVADVHALIRKEAA